MALAVTYTGLTPRGHYERRKAIREVEQKVPKPAKLGIYDRYAARSRLLHGEVFYEGVPDPSLLKIEIEKVLGLIEIAKACVRNIKETCFRSISWSEPPREQRS